MTIADNNKDKKGWKLNFEAAITIRITTMISAIIISILFSLVSFKNLGFMTKTISTIEELLNR
ncbi:MAG: hypothetical protein DRJ07_16600 [Bacteroidetes bacterium]|nr:MAG: hypothetical protein DRJ07_16600 [Bacteroidota bacterium]